MPKLPPLEKVSLWMAAVCLAASVAHAGEPVPYSARAGESLARDAATAWSGDAKLVYVENDEDVQLGGTAGRWGYLYYSEIRQKARAYSIRDGKIRTAIDLPFDFEAPPLPDEWIDSGAALLTAEKEKGADFREKHAGTLRAMVLVRGILHPDDPDAPTWAVVYDSETSPGLWVVIDARTGEVVKTWRG